MSPRNGIVTSVPPACHVTDLAGNEKRAVVGTSTRWESCADRAQPAGSGTQACGSRATTSATEAAAVAYVLVNSWPSSQLGKIIAPPECSSSAQPSRLADMEIWVLTSFLQYPK